MHILKRLNKDKTTANVEVSITVAGTDIESMSIRDSYIEELNKTSRSPYGKRVLNESDYKFILSPMGRKLFSADLVARVENGER